MNYKGYTGKLLCVDLSNNKLSAEDINPNDTELFIGGSGIGANILSKKTDSKTDPLSPENPLIFMTGPLTGTPVPWSGRHAVVSLSPLTGIWGESYCGGTWGSELKRAGFDGIIIKGKSAKPVYIWINNGRADIRDSSHLWGKDTFETEQLIKKETDEKGSVTCIGQAGENLVKIACVMADGKAGRAAARCGFGAVMGAKNLKAIAVRGEKKPGIYDEENLRESIKKRLPKFTHDKEHMLSKVRYVFNGFADDGRHGINNWRDGELDGFKKRLIEEVESHVKNGMPYLCRHCYTGCVESNIIGDKRSTLWEVLAPLGSQCGIADMHAINKIYEMCNRYGIDCISAGGTISFAMEAFEEGIITKKDADGLDLHFGGAESVLELLKKIAMKKGIGEVLAGGARSAAEYFGGKAPELAIHGKGLEVPAHEPRSHNFLALAYATDNRGACHCSASNPRTSQEDFVDLMKIRFDIKGTGKMVARRQNYTSMLNSLVLCIFSQAGYAQYYTPKDFPGISANDVTEWFKYVTGREIGMEEFLQTGEKIFNLKHLINLNRGITSKDDTLSKRLLEEKRGGSSPASENLPPLKPMLEEYYLSRGWDKDGKPEKEKLEELGLR